MCNEKEIPRGFIPNSGFYVKTCISVKLSVVLTNRQV